MRWKREFILYTYSEAVVTPGDEVHLRRYMSMAKLVAILGTRSLYFPTLWQLDDRREGTLPTQWSSPETTDFEIAIRNRVNVSCWHEEEKESDALWKLYALKEEAVAIRTTVGRLKNLLDQVTTTCHLGRVVYIDDTSREQAKAAVSSEYKLYYPFMFKRAWFAHEREVRAVILPEVVYAGKGDKSTPEPGIAVSANIEELVEELIVSPYADRWFFEALTSLMAKLGFEIPVSYSELR